MKPRILISMLLCLTVALAAWFARNRQPLTVASADVLPPRGPNEQQYVGSDACRSCHEDQHASWHATYHRTMTQPATPDTVFAPFDRELEIEGQRFRLFREDDSFWVEMDDPEWEKRLFDANLDARKQPKRKRTIAQVVMTTGSHHFQVYWTRSEYGRELWQFPLRYDLTEKQWVHRKDVFLGPPTWRPGMRFRVWNNDCIHCHATGGRPGLDPASGLMEHTTVSEFGIACEACHGPGGEHVASHDTAPNDIRESNTSSDPTIINPAKLDHELSSEICGQCHSNFIHDDPDLVVTGSKYRPGRRLTEFGRFYRPQLEADDDIVSRFWLDGVNRSTGREFMGVRDSPCYRRGELSCLSCHSMHESDPNDQLTAGMDTNEACFQCHAGFRDRLTEHTHHAADSSGSLCYNCHMPHTNYALFKATRSHQVTNPVAQSIEHKSRLNACNLCHLDQTLAWTANKLEDWYGQPVPSLQTDEHEISAWALWALRGDAGQRVVAAWHPRWNAAQEASGTDWLRPVLDELAKDPYAAVQHVATASQKRLPTVGDDTGKKVANERGKSLDSQVIAEILSRRDTTPIASVE